LALTELDVDVEVWAPLPPLLDWPGVELPVEAEDDVFVAAWAPPAGVLDGLGVLLALEPCAPFDPEPDAGGQAALDPVEAEVCVPVAA
jgi:hypothetical protein